MTREEFNAERKRIEAEYEERMLEIAEASEELGHAYGTTTAQAYVAEEMNRNVQQHNYQTELAQQAARQFEMDSQLQYDQTLLQHFNAMW